MQIETLVSDKVATKAKQRLENLLDESRRYPVLLMLSGGSSLHIIDEIDDSVLGDNLTVTVLDERFTSDPQLNNWWQISQTDFYTRAQSAGASFIETIPKQQESLTKFAARWEKELRTWIKRHPHRKTIATIGIGTDGHVAGISPFPNHPERFVEFVFTDKWVIGYQGNLEPSERVTVTAKFMEDKLDVGIVYLVGENKKSALEKVMANEGRMADTPARILREMKQVEVFTDIMVSM